MTRAALLLSLGLITIEMAQAAPPVGWRFEVVSDPSRRYEPDAGDVSGAGPRPVAITVFYPGAAGAGRPDRLEAFARLDAYNRFREPPETALADSAAAAFKSAASGTAARLTRSVRDAEPSAGRHPLVLFAHSTPLGMAAMSEELASHGFVVAGVISRGAERGAYRLSVADVQAMGDDLRFALERLRGLPFVETSRISVIGMSNGSLGAVALANQVPVAAIVSLDGTVGERAAARVLPELRSAGMPAVTPPLLHLYTPDNSYLDFATLHERAGECVTVQVPQVGHSDFLTFALLPRASEAETPLRSRAAEKFSSIVRLTREFLDRHVMARASGSVRLTDEDVRLGLTTAPCHDR